MTVDLIQLSGCSLQETGILQYKKHLTFGCIGAKNYKQIDY